MIPTVLRRLANYRIALIEIDNKLKDGSESVDKTVLVINEPDTV